MFLKYLIYIILIGYCYCGTLEQNNYHKLTNDLFGVDGKKINTALPPVAEHNTTIVVSIELTITHLQSLDEVNGILTLNGWMHMGWVDANINWDPASYGGLEEITVSSQSLWKPDVTVLNRANAKLNSFPEVMVIIGYPGYVYYTPPVTLETTCFMDHKLYPFDDQICYIEIGSWTKYMHEIDLRVLKLQNSSFTEAVLLLNYNTENPTWKFVQASVGLLVTKFPCCPNLQYPYAYYKLVIGRRLHFYKYLIIIPSVLSIILTFVTFLLPRTNSKKLSLGMFNSFVLIQLLLYMGWTIPFGGTNTPRIVIFCASSLVLMVFSIVFTILANRTLLNADTPVHPTIKSFLQGNWNKFLFLRQKMGDSQLIEGDTEGQDLQTRNTNNEDWILLLNILERILFFVYVIIFIILMATCLI